MRHWITVLGFAALLVGCSGEAQTAQEEQVSSASNELMIGGGFGAASCPGGKSPACVVCNNGCKYACAGDYTCEADKNFCSYSPGKCTTLSFAPTFGGTFMY